MTKRVCNYIKRGRNTLKIQTSGQFIFEWCNAKHADQAFSVVAPELSANSTQFSLYLLQPLLPCGLTQAASIFFEECSAFCRFNVAALNLMCINCGTTTASPASATGAHNRYAPKSVSPCHNDQIAVLLQSIAGAS